MFDERQKRRRGRVEAQIVLVVLMLLSFTAGCFTTSPALKTVVSVQGIALTEYTTAAGEAIEAHEGELHGHDAGYWLQVQKRLLRNQIDIEKLTGVRENEAETDN